MYSKSGTVKSTNPLRILLDGESVEKEFKRLESYVPKINDRVILIVHGSSYVVIGSVI